jgi:hypothetical protein
MEVAVEFMVDGLEGFEVRAGRATEHH